MPQYPVPNLSATNSITKQTHQKHEILIHRQCTTNCIPNLKFEMSGNMARCDRNLKQESIPGGCIFPLRWPPLNVSNRGVPSRGGAVSSRRCAFQGWGCTFPWVYLSCTVYLSPGIPTSCYKHPCPLSGIPQSWYISPPQYSNLLVYPHPWYTHPSIPTPWYTHHPSPWYTRPQKGHRTRDTHPPL